MIPSLRSSILAVWFAAAAVSWAAFVPPIEASSTEDRIARFCAAMTDETRSEFEPCQEQAMRTGPGQSGE